LGLDFVPFGQRITSTRELNAGQVIWMARAGTPSSEWSRVSVVEVDEAMFRAVPPNDSTTATKPALTSGDTIQCRLWRDEDARYMFDVTLARVEKSPPGWVLRHTSQLSRTQSRADYRVQHDQATTIGVLDGSVDGEITSAKERRVITRLRGRINSLSAGGLALLIHQPIPKQVLLRISLDLPGYEIFETEARIVSSSAMSGGRWLVRVSFVNLDEYKRDSVAHYVLHRQQPLLRAELRAE
jgi:c-di-GMP-binding flagellar brake protein YcgR